MYSNHIIGERMQRGKCASRERDRERERERERDCTLGYKVFDN